MQKLIATLFLLFIHVVLFCQQPVFTSYTTKDGLTNNYVESIVQDKNGYIWIATRMGLNRFNGTEFKHFFVTPSDSNSLPFNNIISLFVDDSNTLWLGSYGSQIASYNYNNQKFTSYKLENTPEAKDLDIGQIFYNNEKKICLRTSNGVYALDNVIFKKEKLQQKYVYIRTDSTSINNEHWFATEHGIEHVKSSGEKEIFTSENTPGLLSNSINVVIKDRDGNLWFGTHSGGVVKVSKTTEQIQFFSLKNFPIKNNIVTSFYEDPKGNLWIATDGGGISVVDYNFNLIKSINLPENEKSSSVLDFKYADNQLWAANWKTGIFSINIDNFRIQSFTQKFSEAGLTNNIKAIEIKGDTVFCGSYGDGIILINKNDGNIISYKTSPEHAHLRIPNYINDLFVDSDGEIWVASTRGLFTFKNFSFNTVNVDISKSHKNDYQMTWTVREGVNHQIFVATSFGAYTINKDLKTVKALNLGISLPYDVKLILEDSKNRIWMGAHDNLFVYKPDGSLASMKMTQSDFPIEIFNSGAIFQARNNSMYLGTIDGFYKFIPDSFDVNCKSPEIILETFSRKSVEQIPGTTGILHKHINESESIELKYDDFPVSLTFASINFNNQIAVKFSYQLEGIDSTWMQVTGKNELVFHQLKPGTYLLKIRNTNKYGKWDTNFKSLVINVTPPLWQTWWFRLLITIMMIASIIIFYRVRVRNLRMQKILLQKEVAIQTRTLREQNEEIIEQKKKLELQADTLQEKLLEVHDQKEDLEALNIELTEQSEELNTTNNYLTSVVDTKNKLLSIIAHDLKNPFNVILLAAERLYKTDKTDIKKEHHEYAELIYTASKNIYTILLNLLDWALSQSGLVTFSPADIRLNDFLKAEAENNKVFASQKNIRLSVSCQEHICCFADEQMLRIVIRNLVQNSTKFTHEGGMISIHCTEEEQFVKIEIIDTGIGMDDVTIQLLFEVSSVISEKGTRDEEGRGLGLLVVKEFIERNRGSIEVKSKKNKGSNFIIRLPKGNSDVTENTKTISEAIIPNTIDKNSEITILLVDDNIRLREQLSKSIGDYFTVVACDNALDAVEVCKTRKVDLLISDIVMSDMDGITLCNIIKNELKKAIPVILITGVEESDIQVQAYNSGADAFIKKPFEFDVLLARVQNLLKPQQSSQKMIFSLDDKNLKPHDEKFFEKLKFEVEKGLPNAEFSVEILSDTLGMSRASLFRKTRRVLGISPSEYIQHARMQIAARILQDKQLRISDVAYMVGFSDPHYFSNCFTKHYGVSPSEYKEKMR